MASLNFSTAPWKSFAAKSLSVNESCQSCAALIKMLPQLLTAFGLQLVGAHVEYVTLISSRTIQRCL